MAEQEKGIELEIMSWKDYEAARPELEKGVVRIVSSASLDCRVDEENRDIVVLTGEKEDFDEHRTVPCRISVSRWHLTDVLRSLNALARIEEDDGTVISVYPMLRNGLTEFVTAVNDGKPRRWVRDLEMAFKLQKTQYRSKSPYAIIECWLDGYAGMLRDGFEKMGWYR